MLTSQEIKSLFDQHAHPAPQLNPTYSGLYHKDIFLIY